MALVFRKFTIYNNTILQSVEFSFLFYSWTWVFFPWGFTQDTRPWPEVCIYDCGALREWACDWAVRFVVLYCSSYWKLLPRTRKRRYNMHENLNNWWINLSVPNILASCSLWKNMPEFPNLPFSHFLCLIWESNYISMTGLLT